MGSAKANEVLLLGKVLTAFEGKECGIVTEVIEHGILAEVTHARLETMASLPKQSLRLSKQLIREPQIKLLEEANERECVLLEKR